MASTGTGKSGLADGFRWGDHLGLLTSALVPIMAVCQVSAAVSYDLQATIAILGSTNSPLSILLRAFVASFPVMGPLLTGSFVALVVGVKITGERPYVKMTNGLLSKLAPLLIGVLVLSVALTPWPLLVTSVLFSVVVTMFFVFWTSLPGWIVKFCRVVVPKMRGKVPRKQRIYASLSGRPEEFAKTGLRLLIVAALCLIWLIGSPWAPYEILKMPGKASFTGQVVGVESNSLVVITGGDHRSLIRVPVEKTERTSCRRVDANLSESRAARRDEEIEFWSERSLLKIIFGGPDFQLPMCVEANTPR